MTERDLDQPVPTASRRAVLLGTGALGAAGLLAACGGDTPTPPGQGGPGPTGPGGGGTTAGPAPTRPPIKTTDIPVGGGVIFPERNVVVTQPTAGTFKAFHATCTHQGCQVAAVSGDRISCACHGSQFSIADGSVTGGPALRALAPKRVSVDGDTLTIS